MKPTTPPFTTGDGRGSGPPPVDTNDTPSTGEYGGARSPKEANKRRANGFHVDDFGMESPRAMQKSSLIVALSPQEVARGDGIVPNIYLYEDADGDQADGFLICDKKHKSQFSYRR